MKGIYAGAILTAPQLWQKAKLYAMKPEINGGYKQTTPFRDIKVMLKDLSKRAKSQGGARVRGHNQEVWTRETLPVGEFLLINHEVYRIMADTSWEFQAGFVSYEIEKVIGDNGLPTYEPAANLGAGEM